MDTAEACTRAKRARELGAPQMTFDWNKAAQIIKTRRAENADAGLREDWGWTAGTILIDGKIQHNERMYLSSNWATPVLRIGDEVFDCWIYEKDAPGWDADTCWPQSAQDIING